MEFWNNYIVVFLDSMGLTAVAAAKYRIFYIYILSSVIIAFLYFRLIFIQKKSNKKLSFLRYILPKSIWLHRSAVIDYQLFVLNNLLKVLLIAPYFMAHLTAAYLVTSAWEYFWTYQDALSLNSNYINLLYSVVFILLSDFSRFLFHYCFHKIPILWQFHKVHHSAEVLTPMTLYRVHPFEYICLKMRSVIVFGAITGSFYFWFRAGLQPISILKIHAAIFIFNLLGANLRHSHIPIRFGKYFERIFISPAQHQIHHSNDSIHFDKNFGSIFAFWDGLFGTLEISQQEQKIRFGIEAQEQKKYKTLSDNILKPILGLFSNKS